MKYSYVLIGLSLLITSCISIPNQFSGLAPGMWRAYLILEEVPYTEDPEKLGITNLENAAELPFNFEVIYTDPETFHIEIINGEERIKIDDIYIGRNKATARDTIKIDFPIYESHIIGEFEAGMINGKWVVETRENYAIPFVARFGQDHRFTQLRKTPKIDLSGKWEADFEVDREESYPAIGEFEQDGNRLTGTFMTETGDYRYLQGTIQDDKFYLSCFDGAHAFLFTGKVLEDESLLGTFSSGKHYACIWNARRNSEAKLTDPNELTYLKDGYDRLEFQFPNTDGNLISIDDEKYKNKPKIVQIFGTWCPNCRDETAFLSNYIKNEEVKDLEVIALAFEKRKDDSKAMAAISRYKEHFNVPYEILLAGPNNKAKAAEKLPMLNHILSYPTMIFVDRNDRITKMHTGFNGPATSEFENFKKDFKKNVEEILSE